MHIEFFRTKLILMSLAAHTFDSNLLKKEEAAVICQERSQEQVQGAE